MLELLAPMPPLAHDCAGDDEPSLEELEDMSVWSTSGPQARMLASHKDLRLRKILLREVSHE